MEVSRFSQYRMPVQFSSESGNSKVVDRQNLFGMLAEGNYSDMESSLRCGIDANCRDYSVRVKTF